MKRLVYLARTGPAFCVHASPPRVRIRRVSQRTLFPIKEKLHASEEAWQKFTERARRDGVTVGQLFRALIYGYGEGKDALKLPPAPQDKK